MLGFRAPDPCPDAGRRNAGRRGNALATVTAFGSADSHDEHYFSHPDQMIRGAVDDPTLTLDNREIFAAVKLDLIFRASPPRPAG